jgi:hypothetical protein
MSQLEQAIAHMSQQEGMTDFSCWYSMSRDGVWAWHASVKIDERSCHVSSGTDPINALLNALGIAYADRPNRKGPIT